jgi:hypothetical protein
MNYAAHLFPAVDFESDTGLSLAQEQRELDALQIAIQNDCRKIASLESAITLLEDTKGGLSPIQVQMIQIVARDCGVTMGHHRAGFAMEAYQGDRGRQLLTLTLEGFKETFRKIIEWVMDKLRKLKAWIVAFLDRRYLQLLQLEQALFDPNRHFSRPHGSQVEAFQRLFTLNGHFSPIDVMRNISKTVSGLAAPSYTDALHKYSATVADVVKKFLDDTGGNNWRRYVEDVNKIEMPLPEHFETMETARTESHYGSPPLLGGGRIRFIGVSTGNDSGARGARARSQALAHVRMEHEDEVANEGPRSTWHDTGGMLEIEKYARGGARYQEDMLFLRRLLSEAKGLVTRSKHFVSFLDRDQSTLKTLQGEKTEELNGEAHAIVSNLVHSLAAQSSLAIKLVQETADQAIYTGNIYTHLRGIR